MRLVTLAIILSVGFVLVLGQSDPIHEIESTEFTTIMTDESSITVEEEHKTTQEETTTEKTTTTTTRTNYCAELAPFCSCMASPIVLKCDAFNDFSQLDFSLLDDNSLLRQQTFELELFPETPLTLGNTLNLSPLKFDPHAKIILKNIDGFELIANPFHDLSEDNGLYLNIYESTVRTVGACDMDQLPEDYDAPGLFASFSYVLFSNLTYTDEFCPLIFHQANISFMEAYYMSPDNYLHFSAINNLPVGFDLETFINLFKITFAPNFIVTKELLNEHVFKNLREFNLDNLRLAQVEDDAFENTQRLTRIFMTLENVEEFFKSSTNDWMNGLNVDVSVDYNDPQSIEDNRNRSLVIQVNNRNTGQSYLYPDEDLVYFQQFPHDRFVFYRMLTDTDIECTQTMKFLLKNILYYEPVSYLNTTSAYKCFLIPATTHEPTQELSSHEAVSTTHDASTNEPTSSTTITSTTNATTTNSTTSIEITTHNPIRNTTYLDINDKLVAYSTFLAVVIPLSVVAGISLIVAIGLIIKLCCFPPRPQVVPSYNMRDL